MKTKITLLVFMTIFSLSLFSTNFTVSNNGDAGAGSLRQAIIDANLDLLTPHNITFDASYTIALSTVLPTITKTLTIDGGANAITISGYSVSGNSLVSGANTTLTKLTFDKALVSLSSTAISNNCTFKNGTAGALKASASFTANNCTFDSNAQTTATSGSAVWGNSSTNVITLNDCVVSNNTSTTGPAIYVTGNNAVSSLTINNCIVKNNSNTGASAYGGGIASSAVMNITNSQISGNTCTYRGGGIAVLIGTATLKSKLTMNNCTVSGNTATGVDGGICIQGTSTNVTDVISLTNCTISGNTSTGAGGGGIGFGQGASGTVWTCNIVVTNCTITGNTSSGNTAASVGGGINKNGGTTVSVKLNYSIVAGNNSNSTVAGKDITSVAGFMSSDTGRNLYGGTPSWGTSVKTGNVVLTDDISTILNTTLTDNGGTTALPDGSYVKTHALVAACAAVNPDATGVSGMPTTDQRGLTRDVTSDIGSYERVLLSTPNLGAASTAPTGITANWTAVTNAISYDVKVYQNGSFVKTVNVIDPIATSVTINGLQYNTSYTFTVTAIGNNVKYFSSNESAQSEIVTTDLGTSVAETSNRSQISVKGNTIYLTEAGTIEVFNIQGCELLKIENADYLKTELPTGIYIIRTKIKNTISIKKVIL